MQEPIPVEAQIVTVDVDVTPTLPLTLARVIVEATGVQPAMREEAVSFGLLYDYDHPLNRQRSGSHLTHSTSVENQIRFGRQERILRHFRRIGACLARSRRLTIEIYNSQNADTGSAAFLHELSRVAGVRLTFYPHQAAARARAFTQLYRPSAREAAVEQLIHRVDALSHGEAADLRATAATFLYLGNYWAANVVLKRLLRDDASADCFYLLGLTASFFEDTTTAQYYFERMHACGSLLYQVKASYVLAMLFARHHPAYLRSDDKAAEYLESAYRLLETATTAEVPDVRFQRVFNRNGYALVVFRRGRVEEAADYLINGLRELDEDASETVSLHKSVLLYNLAQCYKALGQTEQTIATYRQLISLDPEFCEYRLELAKCLLDQDTPQTDAEAQACLLEAYALDPTNPDCHSLLGYTASTNGQYEHAQTFYRLAYDSDPENPEYAYDLAFVLVQTGRYEQARSALSTIAPSRCGRKHVEDIYALKAALAQHTGESPETFLRQGIALCPSSDFLAENLLQLQAGPQHDQVV